MNRVGLVGFAGDTGLGNAARDFYIHLPFARWLVIDHPRFGINRSCLDNRCTIGGVNMPGAAVDAWLDGLDAVFAIQHGYVPQLCQRAKRRGLLTVLLVNAEWFAAAHPDIVDFDRFIAPTAVCAMLLNGAGFGDRTISLPHPIDTDRFAFRQRERAEVFLHVAGHDDGDRKGTSFVLEAARRCPEVPFIVRAQDDVGPVPANVRLLGPVDRPEELYALGDVAIQPSRYEGVGLPILEAMASGMPTIVPDGLPMNEYPADPAFVVPAKRGWGNLVGQPFPVVEIDIDALVARIRSLHHTSIAAQSEAARARMVERSWQQLGPAFFAALGFGEEAATGITRVPDPSISHITPFPTA